MELFSIRIQRTFQLVSTHPYLFFNGTYVFRKEQVLSARGLVFWQEPLLPE